MSVCKGPVGAKKSLFISTFSSLPPPPFSLYSLWKLPITSGQKQCIWGASFISEQDEPLSVDGYTTFRMTADFDLLRNALKHRLSLQSPLVFPSILSPWHVAVSPWRCQHIPDKQDASAAMGWKPLVNKVCQNECPFSFLCDSALHQQTHLSADPTATCPDSAASLENLHFLYPTCFCFLLCHHLLRD